MRLNAHRCAISASIKISNAALFKEVAKPVDVLLRESEGSSLCAPTSAQGVTKPHRQLDLRERLHVE
jgi:hypothetical protein